MEASSSDNQAETPVIDFKAALEIYGGDEDFLRSILGTALSEIVGLLPQLTKAIQAADVEVAQRLAHTIKGAARAVAALATQDAAYKVEEASKHGDFDLAAQLMEPLTTEVDRFSEAAKAYGS